MNKIEIKRIKFGSHLKLSTLYGLSAGIVFGLIGLIFGILGGNVHANVGAMEMFGLKAGIAMLIIGPINLTIFGFFGGLLSYLPFRLFMKFKKRINVYYVPADLGVVMDVLEEEVLNDDIND